MFTHINESEKMENLENANEEINTNQLLFLVSEKYLSQKSFQVIVSIFPNEWTDHLPHHLNQRIMNMFEYAPSQPYGLVIHILPLKWENIHECIITDAHGMIDINVYFQANVYLPQKGHCIFGIVDFISTQGIFLHMQSLRIFISNEQCIQDGWKILPTTFGTPNTSLSLLHTNTNIKKIVNPSLRVHVKLLSVRQQYENWIALATLCLE